MTSGVYMIKSNGNIVIFKNVTVYPKADLVDELEDMALLTWVSELREFKKTLIKESQFKNFYRLGSM